MQRLLVIIFRYLAREVILTMSAVSGAILIIIMSGRFVKFLAQAAAGEISADVLFAIIGFRIPNFLELVLPLGFFIGVLLAYGRLYTDSEMTVLFACGMSRTRLVIYTLVPALLVALIVGSFSLYWAPLGFQKVEEILEDQSKLTELDTLIPGRFLSQGDSRVVYTEKLTSDRLQMQNVFISAADKKSADGDVRVVVAESGRQEINKRQGSRYLVLSNGYQYKGLPGKADYQILQFTHYGQLIESPAERELAIVERDALPTDVLWNSNELQDIAALQWRISITILVPILALLAIPLSQTNPRSGRYNKLIPALLLYVIYLVLLNGARDSVEEGKISPLIGLWWVHGIYLGLAALLLGYDSFKRATQRMKQS